MRKTSIVNEIQSRIATGKLQHGFKLPSERQLAIELGVSRTSVQGALKELESLGVVTRQANCRPKVSITGSKISDQIRSTKDQIAVWMLPESQDWGGLMMLQGIRASLSDRNYNLLISSPPSYDSESISSAEIQFLKSTIENSKIAGVITWDTGNRECHALYEDIIAAGIPLVFVDRKPDYTISADFIGVNNRKASAIAVTFLIEQGHTSIAMVSGHEQASSVSDRTEGYSYALRRAGLPQESRWKLHLDTRPDKVNQSSDDLMRRLTSEPDGPTAVFAVNDRAAFHLMEAAKRLGIAIPERLSLIGFDWVARWMPSGGDLTTVAQPFEEIGREAARRILDRISRPTAATREILFDAELVLRTNTVRPIRT